jgi:hypothetical protein
VLHALINGDASGMSPTIMAEAPCRTSSYPQTSPPW